jgi:PI-3-kinase-related kinase SMG-1
VIVIVTVCGCLQVCEDWLTKERGVLLRIASLTESHAAVLWVGIRRLHDLEAAVTTALAKQAAAAVTAQPSNPSTPAPSQQQQQQQQQSHVANVKGKQGKPAPALLKKPQIRGGDMDGAGSAAVPTAAGATGASPPVTQPSPSPLIALLSDVVKTLEAVSAALLHTGDRQGLQGLHAWANDAFAPLLRPAAASSSSSPSGMRSSSSLGEGAEANTAARYEDPLLWLLGLCEQSGGCYEAALHHYITFLRQQAAREAAAAVSVQTAISVGAPSARDIAASLSRLQLLVAQRVADCYAALSDWGGFQAFVSAQRKRAAPWWSAFAASAHLRDICQLASFDTKGAAGVVEVRPALGVLQSAYCLLVHF